MIFLFQKLYSAGRSWLSANEDFDGSEGDTNDKANTFSVPDWETSVIRSIAV